MINIVKPIAIALAASVAGQCFALRTEVGLLRLFEGEIGSRELGCFSGLPHPGMDAIFEPWLPSQALVSLAKLDVGDIGVQSLDLAQCQAGETVIIAVCRKNNVRLILLRQMLNISPDIFLNDNLSFEQINEAQKSPTDRFSKAYSSPQVIYRYNAITAVFRGTSAEYNVPLLDFRKEFLESTSGSKENFFSDDIHLTSKGNDLLGKLTTKYILSDPTAK